MQDTDQQQANVDIVTTEDNTNSVQQKELLQQAQKLLLQVNELIEQAAEFAQNEESLDY